MKINSINSNTNFTARFEPSKGLNLAFERAYYDTYNRSEYKSTGRFINSVNYLLNDGTDDIYRLDYGSDYKAALYKNGEMVLNGNINTMYLLTNYVKHDLGVDVNKPVVKEKVSERLKELEKKETAILEQLNALRNEEYAERNSACFETLDKLEELKISLLG